MVTFENAVLATVEVETRLQGIKFLLDDEESEAGRRAWTFKNFENEVYGRSRAKACIVCNIKGRCF